jgi:protease-4
MKKFLLGLACGLALAVLFAVVLMFSLIRLSDRRPSIAGGSVLMLRIEGDIPEKPPVEIPLPFFTGRSHLTVRDIWSVLNRAAEDDRIKGVVLVPRNLRIGWGKMQEIRESLVAFQKSGKPVYAFLRFAGTREYYLATAAEKIYAGPEDFVDLKGLRIEAMFFRNSLDKLGIDLDVVPAGKYKDAYDVFTRTSMSPETRQVLNQILDQYYFSLVETIAAGRKKDAGVIRAVLDKGPFVAKSAEAAGLVDALGYEDQLMGDLGKRVNQSALKKIEARDYQRGLGPDPSRTRIALVVAQGVIMQGADRGEFSSDLGVTSGAFIKLLRRVKADRTIKGVIVRVDSPGGDATASDDILHEMKELSRSKPLVISMSDVAASGGYYIAVTGDPIVAYPNTLTGSIGVLTAKPNLKGLYSKLGITKQLLTRGRFAALDSDYSDLSVAERAKLNEIVEAIYRGFIDRVATGRKRPHAEIQNVAEGRVWLGQQAKENGLVDRLGGLHSALELVREKANIAAGEKVTLVPYPPRRSLFEVLMSRSDETTLAEAKVNAMLARLPGGHWIEALLGGGTLAVMPYFVEVH